MPPPDAHRLSLAEALKRFRFWAAEGHEGTSGEWECDYESWDEIYEAFARAIAHHPPQASVEDILYALARDNEIGELKWQLTRQPGLLLSLVPAALASPESYARWQIAISLGEMGSPEALDQLRRFLDDQTELVRRLSLLAYAPQRPQEAEPIAWDWISSPEPYSRLAALHILRDTKSSRLPRALQILKDDPFDIVRERASEFASANAR